MFSTAPTKENKRSRLVLTIHLYSYKEGEIVVQLLSMSGEPFLTKAYASNQVVKACDLLRDVWLQRARESCHQMFPRVSLVLRGSTKPLERWEVVWEPRLNRHLRQRVKVFANTPIEP
jgi:hypothetical protein